jgi:hypothetical protein
VIDTGGWAQTKRSKTDGCPVFNTESKQIEDPRKGRNPLVLEVEASLEGIPHRSGRLLLLRRGRQSCDRLQSLEDLSWMLDSTASAHAHHVGWRRRDGMKAVLGYGQWAVNWQEVVFSWASGCREKCSSECVGRTLATDVMGYTLERLWRIPHRV